MQTVATQATQATQATGATLTPIPTVASAKVYDIRTAAGKVAILDAARKTARLTLWLNWQQGYVPRDLAGVAHSLTRIYGNGAMLVCGKDGATHAASERERRVIQALMLRGHLSGLADAFAEFLTHSGYQVPRALSNRYCGWR